MDIEKNETLEECVKNFSHINEIPNFDYIGLPKQTYIIACTGRDGSSLLCDLLAKTGVAGTPDEYLNYLEGGYLAKAQKCVDFSLDKYIQVIISATTTLNGVFGDKGFYYFYGKSHFPFDKYNPKYIYLSRKDKIRQGISFYKLNETGVWNSTIKTNKKITEEDYSYEKIYKMVSWSTNQDEAWKIFFEKRGITPVRVIYEDFIEDMSGTVSSVLKEALDIDFPAENVPAPNLKKQADELSEYFYNRYVEEDRERSKTLAVVSIKEKIWRSGTFTGVSNDFIFIKIKRTGAYKITVKGEGFAAVGIYSYDIYNGYNNLKATNFCYANDSSSKFLPLKLKYCKINATEYILKVIWENRYIGYNTNNLTITVNRLDAYEKLDYCELNPTDDVTNAIWLSVDDLIADEKKLMLKEQDEKIAALENKISELEKRLIRTVL